MPRTFLALGLVSAIATVLVAVGFMGPGGGQNVYQMRIEGNSASGYKLRQGDKEPYVLPIKGEIRWDFSNSTNPKEDVRFRIGDEQFDKNDCPVHWQNYWKDCEHKADLTIGKTESVPAKARKGKGKYKFNLYVGKYPNGTMTSIDPELQIDENRFHTLVASLLALLSAVFLFASWWTRRRGSPKP